jgi:hypothetical protein
MYTQSTCSEPNSATPMTQARINAQNIRMNRIVQPMLDGNSDMAGLVNALTPPPATNTCDDFTTSLSLGPVWPWPPIGGGGVPPTAAQIAAAAAQAAAATAATAAAAGVVTVAATPAGSTATTPPASGPGWQQGRMRGGPRFGRSGGRAGGSGYFQKGGIQNQAQAMAPRFDASCAAPTSPAGLSGLGCGGSDLSNILVIALGVTAGLFFAGWIAKEMVSA